MNKKKITIMIIILVIVISLVAFMMFHTKNSNELILKVKTNGGVPYTWEYEIEDSNIVEFIKKDSYIEDKYKNLDGGPVEIRFTFKGLKEGNTTIHLRYVSIVNNSIDKEETYKVKVDKNGNIELN